MNLPQTTIASGQVDAFDLAVDDTNVNWATGLGPLMRAPLDGGAPVVTV